ncbi:MAG: hypothetical protein HND48_05845 [Chloroflexi bacterium]|nr:hypothetical protein [Chloroflexota bacterium]
MTEAGQREARIRLRGHRIAEAFLVNVMGFGWETIFDEAQRMCTGLTPALLDACTRWPDSRSSARTVSRF